MYICGIRLLFPSSFSGSAQFSVSYTFGATQACTIFRVQAPTHNSPSVTVRRHPPRRLQRFKHHVLPTGGTDILVLSPQHLVLLASFPHLSSPPSPSLLHASARAHTCINTRQKPLPRFKIDMSTHSIRSLVSRAPHDQTSSPFKNRRVYTLDTGFGRPRAHIHTHTGYRRRLAQTHTGRSDRVIGTTIDIHTVRSVTAYPGSTATHTQLHHPRVVQTPPRICDRPSPIDIPESKRVGNGTPACHAPPQTRSLPVNLTASRHSLLGSESILPSAIHTGRHTRPQCTRKHAHPGSHHATTGPSRHLGGDDASPIPFLV